MGRYRALAVWAVLAVAAAGVVLATGCNGPAAPAGGTTSTSTTTTIPPGGTPPAPQRYIGELTQPPPSPALPIDLTVFFSLPRASAGGAQPTAVTYVVSGGYNTGAGGIEGTIDGTLDGPPEDGLFTGELTARLAGCTARRLYSGLLSRGALILAAGNILENCSGRSPLTANVSLPPSQPPTTSTVLPGPSTTSSTTTTTTPPGGSTTTSSTTTIPPGGSTTTSSTTTIPPGGSTTTSSTSTIQPGPTTSTTSTTSTIPPGPTTSTTSSISTTTVTTSSTSSTTSTVPASCALFFPFPGPTNVPRAGASLTVTASLGGAVLPVCNDMISWEWSSNSSWISADVPSPNTPRQTSSAIVNLGFSVQANTTGAARTGSIRVRVNRPSLTQQYDYQITQLGQ